MLKRMLDIVIASSALLILSPLYVWVAYKVKKTWDLQYFFVSYVRGYMVNLLK